MDMPKFNSLDAGTQFKIYDRIMKRFEHLTENQIENKAMEHVGEIIQEETLTALAENSGPCEICGMEAETMEWQEFDKNFMCVDCGHVQ